MWVCQRAGPTTVSVATPQGRFMNRVLFVAGLVAICITGCSSPAGSTTRAAQPATTTTAPPATQPADGKKQIQLKVTTTGKANVTYGTSGGMSQAEVDQNWSQVLESDKAFEIITLTVTNGDLNKKNDVTCEIVVDGTSVQKQSGTGTAAMASCNHTIS